MEICLKKPFSVEVHQLLFLCAEYKKNANLTIMLMSEQCFLSSPTNNEEVKMANASSVEEASN